MSLTNPSPRARAGVPFPLLLTLALTLAWAAAAGAAGSGGPAPDFTLKSADGRNIKLSERRGEVVMINFWASWCGPCRQEMPHLDRLYRQYRDLGFTILGVNVEEDPNQARRLLAEIPVSFPVLYDARNEVSRAYRVAAMPTTVILDRNGQIRFRHEGYLPGYEDEYQQQIRSLLRE